MKLKFPKDFFDNAKIDFNTLLYVAIGLIGPAITWEGPVTWKFWLALFYGGLVTLKAKLSPVSNKNNNNNSEGDK